MSSLRNALGRALRRTYLGLPIGWDTRLRAKAWIFRLLAPMLQGTDAYRRWRSMSLSADGRGDPAPAQRIDARLAVRFAEGLYSRYGSEGGPDYVPLQATEPPAGPLAAKAIAFYLPQFHPIPQNDAWWGRGFTEWTNVSRALPQFVGHDQPRLPGELGFYDLRVAEVMHRQAELARLHGVHAFCFHYYWFGGQRLLEGPLDRFIAEGVDLPFCLCWANENWTRRWDGRDDDVLMGQVHGDGSDDAFIADLIPYLRQPNYLRLDGRPLVVVYRPSLLPDCARTLLRWREACRAAGIGEVFLAMVQFDAQDPSECGFDAAVEFPPHKLAEGLPSINATLDILNPGYAGYVVDYGAVSARARAWPMPGFPMFRGVFPGWDNEARKPGRGYTFANATPGAYREWLSSAVADARAHPVAGESVVFINAWNEWAEGAYLEPDRRHGYAFLNATREAMTGAAAPRRLVLACHDAQPHGAQSLALHLLRELKAIGIEVEVLMLGPGPLREQFEHEAVVHDLADASAGAVADCARALRKRGFDAALLNTTVSGRVARPLRAAGFRLVSLVHELPGLLRAYGLDDELQALAECSDSIVVAAPAVKQGLAGFLPEATLDALVRVLPQGLFVRNRHRDDADRTDVRARLRARLGAPADARVVLAVGYGDQRKGLDLLAQSAVLACAQDASLHFAWVGHLDLDLQARALDALTAAGIAGRFHFIGMDFDTDDFYAGADVYALCSREDPFPSVLLESLSVGTPVVAFADTGGGADLVAESGGLLVPAFDTDAYAEALLRVLGDAALRVRLGAEGRQRVERDFRFRDYAFGLLDLAGLRLPRVSVIVPNYNYAAYLEQRLRSITGQTLTPYEIIVLDDASGDDSLARLRELRPALVPEPTVVVNARNSGSVFRQWLRGVELARGEFVWIAEADDLATPEFLATLVPAMLDDPGIVLGYCQSRQIDGTGRVLEDAYHGWTDEISTDRWRSRYVREGEREVAEALAVKNTIPNASAVVFRREPLLAVLSADIEQIARHRVAGDWMTYLRLLKRGRVLFDPRACNLHRRHEASAGARLESGAHFAEVRGMQALAAEEYSLDASARARATRYAERLRSQFGLVHAGD